MLNTTQFSVATTKDSSVFVGYLNSIGAFLSSKGKCFVVMPENLAKHSLTIANLSPLLPAEFTCFFPREDEKQVMVDKMKAQMDKVDYVEPPKPLLICLAKDKQAELTKGLNAMLDK